MIKYKNPEVLYKLGITHREDALERFAEENDFANTTLKNGYNLRVVVSRWVPESTAIKIEGAFYRQIKKDFWTDVKYNGITECRVLTKEQADDIIDRLRERFPIKKYGILNKGRKGYIKVYFMKLERIKTKRDRYDDSIVDY